MSLTEVIGRGGAGALASAFREHADGLSTGEQRCCTRDRLAVCARTRDREHPHTSQQPAERTDLEQLGLGDEVRLAWEGAPQEHRVEIAHVVTCENEAAGGRDLLGIEDSNTVGADEQLGDGHT
jgi:hypothetical protein